MAVARYIKPSTGSNANPSGTYAAPWKTIQYANDNAVAGDTIIVLQEFSAGVPIPYSENIVLNKALNWVFCGCVLDLANTLGWKMSMSAGFSGGTVRGSLAIERANSNGNIVSSDGVNISLFSGVGILSVTTENSNTAGIDIRNGTSRIENCLIACRFVNWAMTAIGANTVVANCTIDDFSRVTGTQSAVVIGSASIFDCCLSNGDQGVEVLGGGFGVANHAKRINTHNVGVPAAGTFSRAAEADDKDTWSVGGYGVNPSYVDTSRKNYTITEAALLPGGGKSGKWGATTATPTGFRSAPRGASNMWLRLSGKYVYVNGETIRTTAVLGGTNAPTTFDDLRGKGVELATGTDGYAEIPVNLLGKLVKFYGFVGQEQKSEGPGANGVIDYDNASAIADMQADEDADTTYTTRDWGALVDAAGNASSKVRVTLRSNGVN